MKPLTLQQAARDAILVQDACNLSGVAHSFMQALEAVTAAMQEEGQGTEWRNTYPIIRLYIDKLASLSGMQGMAGSERFGEASRWCQSQAEGKAEG